MLKIGLVGLGHLGEIHLKNWLQIVDKKDLVIYDVSSDRLLEIAREYDVSYVNSYKSVLESVQIVDIVTPTDKHFDLAQEALKADKHVFIEKPICETLEQAMILDDLQKKAQKLVQIGHVERYNPAYTAIEEYISNPMFFEVHRLAPFNPRGTEVSVIMDLMIHDLDIVLSKVKSPILSISANGVNIVSKTPDIVNARIEFLNGCVANLTASRISMKKMRKMRVFQNDGYISIDFLEKKSEFIKICEQNMDREGLRFVDSEGIEKKLVHKEYNKIDKNAIFEELCDYYSRVKTGVKNTVVNIENSIQVIDVASQIQKKISIK